MTSRFTAEQLAAVVKAAGEAIVVMRPDESVVFANDAAAVTLGAPSAEALHDATLSRILEGFDLLDEHGVELAPDRHTIPRVLAGERQSRAIVRLRPKTGGVDRWTSVTSTAMSDEAGRVEYVVTVLRDVTRKMRAEASLAFLSRASAALGSSLDEDSVLQQLAGLCVPDMADGCAVLLAPPDGSTRHLAVTSLAPENPSLARRLSSLVGARSPSNVLAHVLRSGRSLFAPEVSPRLRERIATTRHAGTLIDALRIRSLMIVPIAARGISHGALVLVMADSRRHFESADLALMEDIAHRAALAIDHARLYSASRAAEIALEAHTEDLAATVRMRDEFLSIASHELKTPLTSLQLHLEMLAHALGECSGEAHAHTASLIDAAKRQHQRLVRLSNELLDVSRIQSGALQLDCETLDLCALTREVAERFTSETKALGATITLDGESSIVGRWDRLRIEQVLTHLISNAVRFGRRAPIRIHISRDEHLARLCVEDHGIGIAPEACERIFGRFERAVSSRNYGGLGLGLYITREIVQAHGGSITVASLLGEGSRFTVELPIADVR